MHVKSRELTKTELNNVKCLTKGDGWLASVKHPMNNSTLTTAGLREGMFTRVPKTGTKDR